jgi:tellurium resistance protein TerD
MGISLKKGQNINLSKDNPNLKKVTLGLGWDVNQYSGADYDLDASAFLLNGAGKCMRDEDFVFYKNLRHDSGAVEHTGDNRTGKGEGDDEAIKVDLSKVPSNIEKIDFVVTIHDAERLRQNFGQVSNAFIRIVDEANGSEIARYDLGEDFSVETAVVFGQLYKNNNDWKFRAIGSGYKGGLEALVRSYGREVER